MNFKLVNSNNLGVIATIAKISALTKNENQIVNHNQMHKYLEVVV